MSLEFTVNTKELQELDKILKQLGPQITRGAGAAALRAAGKVIKDTAKRNLLSKDGGSKYIKVANSIGVKVLRARDIYNRAAVVGHRVDGKYKYIGYLGQIIEYGTLASRTEKLSGRTRRKKQWAVRGKSGTYTAYRRGLPTGLEAKPHFNAAFETTENKQIEAMADAIRKYLKRRGYL